jgi:replicative DNA helicase
VVAGVGAILADVDLYREAHGVIYEAILSLCARGAPIDALATVGELRRTGRLSEAGGDLAVADLTDRVAVPASAPHHAHMVRAHAQRRRIIEVGSAAVAGAYDEQADPNDVATRLADAAGPSWSALAGGRGARGARRRRGRAASVRERRAACNDSAR